MDGTRSLPSFGETKKATGFFDLPRELRDTIYEMAVVSPEKMDICVGGIWNLVQMGPGIKRKHPSIFYCRCKKHSVGGCPCRPEGIFTTFFSLIRTCKQFKKLLRSSPKAIEC